MIAIQQKSDETVSQFVRRLMLERNLSYAEAGRMANTAPAQLGRFVRDERSLTTETFDRLCQGLGLELVDRVAERQVMDKAMDLVVECQTPEHQERVAEAFNLLRLFLKKTLGA